ncbi:uncharacterized protein LOC119745004 [Patiria miniata]|uniref:Uncharacterized protein n=1 Tax=Patiria miniata TaxID=46514 RepID=A0A914BNU0_PATMI|nr:uncharacterized protein LOC119745004 [Patiria miniata]
MAQPLHAHLILSSPLWRPETVPTELPPPPSAQHLAEQEQNFKLDCILVEKLRYKWSPDIIPKYDAMRDPYARHYFKSPVVQSLLRRTLDGADGGRPSPVNPRSRASIKHANIKPAFSLNPPTRQSPSKPQPQPQHSSQPSRLSLNTLSGRHRAPATPTDETLADKRERYCIDSVLATNQVTRYKPLIRPYDAVEDAHARGYFQKPGVKRVLAMTLGADKRSSEKIHSCKVVIYYECVV